jgi:hypothetical protein
VIIDASGLEYHSGNRQISKERWTQSDVSTLRSFARVMPRSAWIARNALADWITSATSALIRHYRRRRGHLPPTDWLEALANPTRRRSHGKM